MTAHLVVTVRMDRLKLLITFGVIEKRAITVKYVSQNVQMDTAVLKGSVKHATDVEMEDMIHYVDIAS